MYYTVYNIHPLRPTKSSADSSQSQLGNKGFKQKKSCDKIFFLADYGLKINTSASKTFAFTTVKA